MTPAGALAAASMALGAAAAWAGEAPRSLRAPIPCPDDAIAVPATGACLRIGGSVGATLTLGTAGRGRALTRGAGADGRVVADVVVPTELRPLRAVGAVRFGSERWKR